MHTYMHYLWVYLFIYYEKDTLRIINIKNYIKTNYFANLEISYNKISH